MEPTAMFKRVMALNVHQAKITACAIVEHDDGRQEMTKLDFGAFKRDRRALAQWALRIRPEVVVMQRARACTGRARLQHSRPWASWPGWSTSGTSRPCPVARPIGPTRRGSPHWRARVCCGRRSSRRWTWRQLRLVARQRQKLVGMLSAQKNRLHKVLVDAGIRINVLVSDVHGQSARAMIKPLIKGQPMHEILDLKGRLGASGEELLEALSTEQFSARHAFVADEIMQHIEYIEQSVARMDGYLPSGLAAWQPQLKLLQTIPGVDQIGAAMLPVEISADMSVLGSAEPLASRVGICPGNNESAGKRKRGRIRKGNAWVRQLLCEFAQAAARTRCALKAKFEARAIRKGRKKSVIALAHKMLRTIYAMISSGSHYQDKTVDYEALSVARNAPRWTKMLRKHGFIETQAAA